MLCIGVFLPKSAATTRFCRRIDTHSLNQLHPRPCPNKTPPSPAAARPHVFYSTTLKHHVRQFGSGPCLKTSPYIPNSIRRADTSDRSGGFSSPYGSHNLSVSNWHRHCRSGSFTRLPTSTIHQTRVCLRALPGPTTRVLLDFPQAECSTDWLRALPEDQPLQSDFHTPSGYQRPVGKFYSSIIKHNPSGPRLPRAKPGTQSGS